MPNTFAYLMLLVWPLVSVFLFRRLSTAGAVIWTILGGYLVLPPATVINLPVLPDPDKVIIPNICAYLGFLATRPRHEQEKKPLALNLVLALFLLTPIGTVLTNLDPVLFAIGGLPPMQMVELPSSILNNFIVVLPFLIGYRLFRDEDSMRHLLVALMAAGLVYSIPMLIEVRLSPQINVWVYGFFQHAFDQMMRYGGFRPIVFLEHGLWVAFFAFMAAFATIALLRLEPEKRQRNFLLSIYLLVVLVLCKSANAVTHIVLFAPIVLFLKPRTQARLAAIVAVTVLFYPALRGAGLIPTGAIANFAASIDAERAGTLIYRLTNEDALLAHASQRPWFGWGGWDRNLVHDPITGAFVGAIDGRWIVTLGISGWFGYVGEMGLLTLPLFSLAARARHHALSSYKYAAAIALILAANLIDLIPNATLIPFTWLMAGALAGRAQAMGNVVARPAAMPDVVPPWARQRTQGEQEKPIG